MADVLADGAEGIIVSPGNAAALSAAATELVADPDRAWALGRAAKEHIAEFGSNRIAKRLDLVYQKVIGSA